MQMIMLTTSLGIFLFTAISVSANHQNGDTVLHVTVGSAAEWIQVEQILKQHLPTENIDVWKYPDNKGDAQILIPRDSYDIISAEFDRAGFAHGVNIDDVGSFLNNMDDQLMRWNTGHTDVVGKYATYDEILSWFEELKANYSGWIDTVDIGSTYEGKPHRLLKLSTGGSGKWKVFIEGGMHAREWIAPATALYITDQIIQGYADGDPEIVDWMSLLDWYILPVANPDGYDYCFTTERLWRKNRRPNAGSNCTGTDLNRNWSYQWGGVGGDPDPCSNTYRGPAPESELEVQNIVNLIMPEADQYIYYQSYHCWGQQFFTRWDYTADEQPLDHDELLDLAERAVEAITGVHGVYYEAGIAPNIMYAFSGSSADWMRGVADIKYPYLEELRDNGTYSFVLPPEQIIPTGEENWAGFQVVVREIMAKCSGTTPPGPCVP